MYNIIQYDKNTNVFFMASSDHMLSSIKNQTKILLVLCVGETLSILKNLEKKSNSMHGRRKVKR